jgi:hypothetical protein
MPNATNTTPKTQRGPKGRFLPGNREGPGRPKGARNRTTVLVEALLEDEARELTRTLIERAKAGFAVPLQLVFERCCRPARTAPCTSRCRRSNFSEPSPALALALIDHDGCRLARLGMSKGSRYRTP